MMQHQPMQPPNQGPAPGPQAPPAPGSQSNIPQEAQAQQLFQAIMGQILGGQAQQVAQAIQDPRVAQIVAQMPPEAQQAIAQALQQAQQQQGAPQAPQAPQAPSGILMP